MLRARALDREGTVDKQVRLCRADQTLVAGKVATKMRPVSPLVPEDLAAAQADNRVRAD